LNILDQLGVVQAGIGPGMSDADTINAKLHHLETPDSRSRPSNNASPSTSRKTYNRAY
jgi:hypothetical protein